MLSPEHAEQRKKGVGSSESWVLVGGNLDPHGRTALDLYLSKMGMGSWDETLPMRVGTFLEPLVADLYAEETGRIVTPAREICATSPRCPHLGASVDRESYDSSPSLGMVDRRVAEMKTAAEVFGWGPSGSTQIPRRYYCQAQHQLLVLDLDKADVAVLIGNSDFRTYTIDADPEFQQEILAMVRAFWEGHVLPRIPPPVDFCHPRAVELLDRLLPPEPGKLISLGSGAAAWADEYEALTETIREAKAQKDECRARLTALMGDAAEGILPDGRSVKRTERQRRGYTVQPSTHVDFRLSKPKQVGNRSPGDGIRAIMGKWPGDEGEEEIRQALEDLS